jgi:hypothetical protein
MTEAEPFTQYKIESRDTFGLFVDGQVRANAPRAADTHEPRYQIVCPWSFDEAINILTCQPRCRIRAADDRARCKSELALIFHLYNLERLAETQETNASKSSAFQKALRWCRRRKRAIARLEQAVQRKDAKLAKSAIAELRAIPWLASSLEQEAAGLQAKGATLRESFMTLRNRYKRASRPGRVESHALTHAIHRLQSLASNYAPNLIWQKRNIPKELLAFILETLDVTQIKHPGFDENPSKFRRLLRKPPLSARSSNKTADADPRPSFTLAVYSAPERATELELRLSKTPL